MKASDLISRKQTRTVLPSKALEELRALVEHNDSVGGNTARRVPASKAVELLQSYKVKVGGRQLLDRICREHLNRRSYGTK